MKILLITTILFILTSSYSLADPDCSDSKIGSGDVGCDHYYMIPAHAGLIAFYKEAILSGKDCHSNSWSASFEKYHSAWLPYIQAKCSYEVGEVAWGNESCEIDEMNTFNKKLFADLTNGFIVGNCEINKREISPGFSCKAAEAPIEKTICGDVYLSIYDRRLNYYYNKAIKSSGNIESLKKNQVEWLKKRNQCNSKHCLIYLYFHRVNEFKDKKDLLW